MQISVDARPLTTDSIHGGHFPPRLTGVGYAVMRTLSALSELDQHNHYQLFYTSHQPMPIPLALSDRISVHHRSLPSSAVSLLWGLKLRSVEAMFGIKPDIVHGTNYQLPFTRRAKAIINFWDMSWAFYPDVVPKRRLAYLRRWVPVAARRADRIICDTQQVKTEICTFFNLPPEKVAVVPLGVDTTLYQPGQPDATNPYLLYVGTLDRRKNLERLLQAYALLKDAPRLVLAGGKGEYYLVLKSLADTLGIASRVEFTGYVTPDDLLALYRGAHGVVLPSLYEGFGLTALEAMACGVPLLISDIPVLREVTDGHAISAKADDVGALAAGLEVLIHDSERRQQLRQEGLAYVQNWTWENSARRQLQLYEAVMAS